jgi:nucleoside-diphosphate-sugar epimerase
MNALVIGGTGFIGRHAVEELLHHDYTVTIVARGEQDDPFADRDGVSFRRADRNERATLESVRDEAEPGIVIDLCGFHPQQVEEATEIFADVDAYVFVSSASAYDPEQLRLPSREDDPLHEYTPEHAEDDSMASYGPRKAECDRVCFRAADEGMNAMVVRPACVYGPYDHTERHDYWFHRVNTYDRILVPGDGDSTFHRVYVEDLATALRIVAERGEPGEAYNAAERQTAWLDLTIDLAAKTLDTDVEVVHANARELARVDLSPMDFPLYLPVPAVAASEKLAGLGWTSTPLEETFARTIEEHLESDRTGADSVTHDFGVDRGDEAALIERLIS